MAPRTDRRAGNLFSHAAHVGEREGELVLPGFQTERAAPVLPLQLYYLGLGAAHSEKTTGAPLALRMFVESILAVNQEDRRGDGPVAISIALRDLLDRLYPGPREPRPNEYWPRLMKAAEALDSTEARIPWHDPETGRGGLRRVVSVGDIPRGPGALDSDGWCRWETSRAGRGRWTTWCVSWWICRPAPGTGRRCRTTSAGGD